MSRKPLDESTRPTQVTLAAVLQVRDGALQVLLWQRGLPPFAGSGRCPAGSSRTARRSSRRSGGTSRRRSTSPRSATSSRSRPTARPAGTPSTGRSPPHTSGSCPSVSIRRCRTTRAGIRSTAFLRRRSTTGAIVHAARDRLRGKLSYSNIGFALAPATFTLNELRAVYAAALGYDVSATNLKRVLLRRGALTATGGRRDSGRAGGRPAEEFAFTEQVLEITDPFAALRPPDSGSQPGPAASAGCSSLHQTADAPEPTIRVRSPRKRSRPNETAVPSTEYPTRSTMSIAEPRRTPRILASDRRASLASTLSIDRTGAQAEATPHQLAQSHRSDPFPRCRERVGTEATSARRRAASPSRGAAARSRRPVRSARARGRMPSVGLRARPRPRSSRCPRRAPRAGGWPRVRPPPSRAASSGSRTNVPPVRPTTRRTSPARSSSPSAWRTVIRLTPSASASRRSGGNRSPTASRPDAIAAPSCSAIATCSGPALRSTESSTYGSTRAA